MPNISFSGNLSGNLLHSVQKIDEYGPYGYKPDLGGAIVFTVGEFEKLVTSFEVETSFLV